MFEQGKRCCQRTFSILMLVMLAQIALGEPPERRGIVPLQSKLIGEMMNAVYGQNGWSKAMADLEDLRMKENNQDLGLNDLLDRNRDSEGAKKLKLSPELRENTLRTVKSLASWLESKKEFPSKFKAHLSTIRLQLDTERVDFDFACSAWYGLALEKSAIETYLVGMAELRGLEERWKSMKKTAELIERQKDALAPESAERKSGSSLDPGNPRTDNGEGRQPRAHR